MKRLLPYILFVELVSAKALGEQPKSSAASPLAWPKISREARPWARWWWLGSAVDQSNVTELLTKYRAAGFGGVEICPIYGAKGAEERYIPYLSPKWVEMLSHTTSEAARLDLGVDLTTGTGWPFGGPNVTAEMASTRLELKDYSMERGDTLNVQIAGTPLCVLAVSWLDDQRFDLTNDVAEGRLRWRAPDNERWWVYVLSRSGPVQKVKRAAPGGEGNVLDPYSWSALEQYLARFDDALEGLKGPKPRAHFHDSFEYYNASWTPDFFDEFKKRRGYDLRSRLPALFGHWKEDEVARVKSDFRETISDLHLAYLERWTNWAHKQGGLSRNQAHGVPGTLLDHYAAVDIPETESFKEVDEKWAPMWKFASSAAHLSGKPLTSAESFTWLGEHFQTSLADLKPAADLLFLAGINHLIYHGMPYSPRDAEWPGWLFYASVNFNPNGGLWRDLPAFNAYIARCQSVLQAGKPDNDLLLYFPVHDLWHWQEGLLKPLTVPGAWMNASPFQDTALDMWERGYSYDIVTDRLLSRATVVDRKIKIGDGEYRAVVVPNAQRMEPATLRKLIDLARYGGTIIFLRNMPVDVPGLFNLEARRAELRSLMEQLRLPSKATSRARIRDLDKGEVFLHESLEVLSFPSVPGEMMSNFGLRCVRRRLSDGHLYFIVNRTARPIDEWVHFKNPAKSVILFDPLTGAPGAKAASRRYEDGGPTDFRIQLNRGQSIVLRTFSDKVVNGPTWPYLQPAGDPVAIGGTWRVEFIEGGPAMPATFQTGSLGSWVSLGDAEAKRFAGTARYSIDFDRPRGKADDWLLNLGKVCESARVRVNGKEVATLWCPPFTASIGRFLKSGRNRLEVEVTNLAANRIADLDRRKVEWKRFNEINFVNRDYKAFDASKWPVRDSGLLGPVGLVPLRK